jgi:hypothetical protein
MENDLLAENKRNAIDIIDFCKVCLSHLRDVWIGKDTDMSIIRMLCTIFEAVDVDRRGYLNWDDFINFCIRNGRNKLNPDTGVTNLEYFQRVDLSPVTPAKQLFYSHDTNILYAFDGESPVVRLFR